MKFDETDRNLNTTLAPLGRHTPPHDHPARDAQAGRAALLQALAGEGAKYLVLAITPNGGTRFHSWVSNPHTALQRMADGYMVAAPAAPDLVVLDLDGCATPGVLAALDQLVARHDAHELLDLAVASGSPTSCHRYYLAPAGQRETLRAALADFRTTYGLDGHGGGELDDRTADGANWRGRLVRMPGSPSRKPGRRPALVTDAGGVALDAWEAVARLAAARALRGLPALPSAARTSVAPGRHADGPARPARPDTPVARPVAADVAQAVQGWPAADRDAVLCSPSVGSRSDVALVGLRAVVRHAGHCWQQVGGLVMALPVFDKYAAGGEQRARMWWERTAGAYVEYCRGGRRRAGEGDTGRLLPWWRWAVARMLQAHPTRVAARALLALAAITAHRLQDGGGLRDRPVAVRDLVVWGVARDEWDGARQLDVLRGAGVLLLTGEYDPAIPLQARRWTVPDVPADLGVDSHYTGIYRGRLPLPSAPAPLWLPAGPVLWLVRSLLPADPSGLARTLGCSRRSVSRYLQALVGLGVVAPTAGGGWAAVGDAAAAPGAVAAGQVLAGRQAVVAAARHVWAVFHTPVLRAARSSRATAGGARARVVAAARRAAAVFQVAGDVLGAPGAAAAPAAGVSVVGRAGAWAGRPHRGHDRGHDPPAHGHHRGYPIDLTNMMEETTL